MRKYLIKLSELFESKVGHLFVCAVVVLNALILGVQTFEEIPVAIELILKHINKIILIIFAGELVIKLLGNGFAFFRNSWNVFDLIVVSASFLTQQDFLPLLRAFRVLHLMSMVDAAPRIQHILKGFWKAVPGIMHVLSILLLFFYIFSVMGVFLFRDLGVAEFQHIGMAMKTMFQVLTGDDWGNIMKGIEKVSPYAWMYFIVFYIILVFIVLNLFIGVVVGSLQAAEEEIFGEDDKKQQRDKFDDLKKQIAGLEKKLDKLLKS